MLNVFMLCPDDPAPVALSLAALMPAVVLGHVGRVVAHTQRAENSLLPLIDEAGCALVTGVDAAALFTAERRQRPGWWLAMRAGQMPMEGWSEEAMRHVALRSQPGAMLPARGFGAIALARLARLFGTASTRYHMLIVPPEQTLKGDGDALGCSRRVIALRTAFEG